MAAEQPGFERSSEEVLIAGHYLRQHAENLLNL